MDGIVEALERSGYMFVTSYPRGNGYVIVVRDAFGTGYQLTVQQAENFTGNMSAFSQY